MGLSTYAGGPSGTNKARSIVFITSATLFDFIAPYCFNSSTNPSFVPSDPLDQKYCNKKGKLKWRLICLNQRRIVTLLRQARKVNNLAPSNYSILSINLSTLIVLLAIYPKFVTKLSIVLCNIADNFPEKVYKILIFFNRDLNAAC